MYDEHYCRQRFFLYQQQQQQQQGRSGSSARAIRGSASATINCRIAGASATE